MKLLYAIRYPCTYLVDNPFLLREATDNTHRS